MLKLLKPNTRENVRENVEEEMENETRSFYTPTKLVRKILTQNDPNISRNTMFASFTDKNRIFPFLNASVS